VCCLPYAEAQARLIAHRSYSCWRGGGGSTGKQNGRGAYLCRQQSCWEKAFKHGSLDRALRTTLTAEMLDALRVFAATLPVTLVTPQMPTAPVDDETVGA